MRACCGSRNGPRPITASCRSGGPICHGDGDPCPRSASCTDSLPEPGCPSPAAEERPVRHACLPGQTPPYPGRRRASAGNSHAGRLSRNPGPVRVAWPCGGTTGRKERTRSWRCPISACASFSKPAFTLATTPAAGTRGWDRTCSACATRFTSSTCSRPCRCSIVRCGRCATSPPLAGACCSSAPSAPLQTTWRRRPSAAASITSTTAGWAARSPTGRPSPAASSVCARSTTCSPATPRA